VDVTILFVFAVATGLALLLTPFAVRVVAARGGAGRRPARDGRPVPVPRLGGIPVAAAAALSIGAALLLPGVEGDRMLAGMLLAGGLLFAAGIIDDLISLRPVVKLAAQSGAALVAFALGFRIEEPSFAGGAVELGWLALPLTVLWIVGVTNAFNLIDGLDGLATGIGIVALGCTLGVSLLLGNAEVALVCAAFAGALVGFLRYNFRPARIFLGDSGSLLVGFMLAVLSVHGSTKSATAVLVAVPLLVLALPLLDTVLAIVRRWLRGRPVFAADEHHLHHRLLAAGITHVRAVVILYVLAAGLAGLGVVLAFGPPAVVVATSAVGGLAMLGLLLFAIRRLGYHEFVEAGSVVSSGLRRVRQSIRDQIHARDVAKVIASAESLDAVRAILEDNASSLGLLHLTICAESAARGGRSELPGHLAPAAWKLECPVGRVAPDAAEPLVLRAWTEAPDDLRMLTVDRTARVIASAVRDRLAAVPVALAERRVATGSAAASPTASVAA
jgi:UDP-GlcNAc:undecaprenyl-phosphate/decaprenyl-phosphate GlcNAc-1-phosphate transferase